MLHQKTTLPRNCLNSVEEEMIFQRVLCNRHLLQVLLSPSEFPVSSLRISQLLNMYSISSPWWPWLLLPTESRLLCCRGLGGEDTARLPGTNCWAVGTIWETGNGCCQASSQPFTYAEKLTATISPVATATFCIVGRWQGHWVAWILFSSCGDAPCLSAWRGGMEMPYELQLVGRSPIWSYCFTCKFAFKKLSVASFWEKMWEGDLS